MPLPVNTDMDLIPDLVVNADHDGLDPSVVRNFPLLPDCEGTIYDDDPSIVPFTTRSLTVSVPLIDMVVLVILKPLTPDVS